MRIISGRYKGRIIRLPRGIRPTQDKVRKAIFDILGDIQGLSFLELFAGSGAVGIEALSRGVRKAVFVEKDKKCIELIRENLEVIRLSGYQVIRSDIIEAVRLLAKDNEKFDIIFLDPPYYKGKAPRLRPSLRLRTSMDDSERSEESRSGSMVSKEDEPLTKKTLQTLLSYDILSPNGLIVVQHFKKDNLPEVLGDLPRTTESRPAKAGVVRGLALFRQARYGDTLLSFYKHS